MAELPWTDHFGQKINTASTHFWGRIDFSYVAALFYMQEKSTIHQLIHRIKYKGRNHDAFVMGNIIGQKIISTVDFPPIDVIVPVPLTDTKKLYRGYNQSEIIAQGIAVSLSSAEVNSNNLIKIKENTSQTGKSRQDRLDNVSNIFHLKNPSVWNGKNILIVDDVITTGATIESCAQRILQGNPASLSVVSIAVAIS
jgi:ComF family protein